MEVARQRAGLTHTRSVEFIDFKSQYAALKESVDARIQRALDHGQYIVDPEVEELESRLATYAGARHCITVASGTEALLISLMGLGIGPGDEVIATTFGFAATAEVIVLLGATPVFVDVEVDSCKFDVSPIEAAITKRTRVIIPVNPYGQMADMDEINEIAARQGNIPVVENGAQSFGADYRGRKSCNLSTNGCTSFFPSKPLGCYGDSGAIFTSDQRLAKAMREIRVRGQEGRHHHTRVGVRGRIDTLQCTIVLAKLERFEWEIRRRIEIGARYGRLLTRFDPEVASIPARPDRTSVHAQYTIRI
jgi:UDP-2-acetamido-2-deoxy-ribo-hexuluronate aminotransferase